MAKDPELIAHQEWLGYLQPVGLVVSPPALAAAGAYPNKNIIPDHARFLECVEEIALEGESEPAIVQFARFATCVLGWEPADLIGTHESGSLPESLEVTLPEYNETLRPTYAVREFSNTTGVDPKWLLLVQKVKAGISPDDVAETEDHRWQASPQARFERLREDAGRHTDTMDHRYGAWAQLLTLFRLIYDGGRHGGLRLPARKGYLFDPDRYPFLEGGCRVGRSSRSEARPTEADEVPGGPHDVEHVVRPTLPRVSDGVVFRVLQNLLILDGERLSYRTLDVEQIGSVYETIMGFNLEVARGRSIAVRPTKPHGAPTTINLEELLAVKPADRAKWLKQQTDQSLTGLALNALKEAKTPEDAVVAIEKKVAKAATPSLVPRGAMVLQPSDERRRSGSHYTPRSLTEPIVETTLRPILGRLGLNPTPEQILDLKICDLAMGSGAFLVAVCRFLADLLVRAWHAHERVPKDIPPDEDETLHARRLVAQRCLYGVDKNPMAVDLAKLSLWLATLAKDHPFTFLDHALRWGDSLVGLSREQIIGFHWKPDKQRDFVRDVIGKRIERATESRREIREAPDNTPESLLTQKLALADEALNPLRFYGDLVIAAFFAGENDRRRKEKLEGLAEGLAAYLTNPHHLNLREPLDAARRKLGSGDKGIHPFHWEIEFPEVFGRENPGFDAFVGNPPFAGKNTMAAGHAEGYPDWLKQIHDESHGNSDLVAHFFRRAFDLLRGNGAFGLIATNTIGQGDTRSTGLRWICTHGGTIFEATRRKKWPGLAAVVVSVVHVGRVGRANARPTETVCGAAERGLVGLTTSRTSFDPPYRLDGRDVSLITAYLFHTGAHDDPATLRANADKSFVGSYILGMGFTFDDTDTKGVANPIALMHELINKNPSNAERVFPYIGGEEVNDSPTHSHHRCVINFGEMAEDEARMWPDLIKLVEEKVKGSRGSHSTAPWWQFERLRNELYAAIRGLDRVLVCPIISNKLSFAFLHADCVFSHKLMIFVFDRCSAFCVLQSRFHEVWVRLLTSTMKDDLNYSNTDCFDNYPFPANHETNPALEASGKTYYEFRADLMVRNNEGLTKTYNRFHDPDERSPDILKLRELHAAMDRAVLDAYGWTDLKPTCEFLLDYEEDEDEDEPTGGRRRKKPWRYRWPDDFR
ncbi:MAG: Eco57I restriction-modification methylase domain-containing protein, partial [Isosphaerales bacterium]